MTIDSIIAIFVAGVVGVFQYLLKAAHISFEKRIEKLEDTTMRREDFKEFKQELFHRLDRIDKKLESHEAN